MATADSARLRAPYGFGRAPAGRRPRDVRVSYERRPAVAVGFNALPLIIVGVTVLGLGAFVGYLVAENKRLQTEVTESAGAQAPVPTPKAVAGDPSNRRVPAITSPIITARESMNACSILVSLISAFSILSLSSAPACYQASASASTNSVVNVNN